MSMVQNSQTNDDEEGQAQQAMMSTPYKEDRIHTSQF
jgi:hypothetical protein